MRISSPLFSLFLHKPRRLLKGPQIYVHRMSEYDNPHTANKQIVQRFHDAVCAGNLSEVQALSKVVDVDVQNDRGWTALMFAARNGWDGLVRILKQKGSNAGFINGMGHNALEIAKFWNHGAVVRELENAPSVQERQREVNYFCNTTLNRYDQKRRDEEWLKNEIKDAKTRFLVLHNLRPLTAKPDKENKTRIHVLHTLSYIQLKAIGFDFDSSTTTCVFLGIENTSNHVWFAVDVSDIGDDDICSSNPSSEFLDMTPRAMMMFSEMEAAIFAQARSMVDWHTRFRFCPTCGSSTTLEEAGYKRKCSNENCDSLKGIHNVSYPRVDPVIIMLIVSPDGQSCLLGRQARFPGKMWSCLAGFVEPGESIEDACRREVHEESRVIVGNVSYHSSQPWPFPSVLMIGCVGQATSCDIKVDHFELEDAKWFPRQQVIQMLTRQHPQGLFLPPAQAIAHSLIKSWVKTNNKL